MALTESRRKFLVQKFEEMFPQLAEDAEKYGGLNRDNGTLCIYLKEHKGTLTFNYITSSLWKLQTYKCYCDHSFVK